MTQDWIVSLIPLLLILVIGLLIGGLVGGLLVSGLRSAEPGTRKQSNSRLKQAVGLWRDSSNENLHVEIDRDMYPSVEKLNDRQINGLLQVLNDLQNWLKLDTSTRLSPNKETIIPNDVISAQAERENILIAALAETPTISQVKPPSLEVRDIVAQVLVPDPKIKVKEAPKSIVAQVDEILQERLKSSEFSKRVIRLAELPQGGMVIVVDGNTYDGVADVPEQEVRSLIQQCVAEWENK